MSNAVSVLNGKSSAGSVTVTDAGLRGMITLRGDLSSDTIKAAVKSVTGLTIPATRKIKTGKNGGVAWMSPDELLLLVDYENADEVTAKLCEQLADTHHMAVNVSDARAIFTISGKGSREVLAKGAPIDLSTTEFGVGDLRRTRIGQLAAAFWMTDTETFELVCFRSVGEFMFDWLENAAQDGGLPGYLE